MGSKTEIDNLSDALKRNDILLAQTYVPGAKKELELVYGLHRDTNEFKEAVKVLENFIKHAEEGRFERAVIARPNAMGPFRLEIKHYLQICIKKESNGKEHSTPNEKRDDVNVHAEKEKKILETHTTADSNLTEVKNVNVEEKKTFSPNDKVQTSGEKQASEDVQGKNTYISLDNTSSSAYAKKLQRNNPDIADLSDVNRPTKLAERFSELYDNEWTEAFDSLQKTKAKETDIVQYLLLILKEAYGFCTVEAEEQMKQLAAAFLGVIAKGKNWKTLDRNQYSMKDSCVLVQIRKECAAEAIPVLKEKFAKHLQNKVQKPAKVKKMETVDHYCEKAVELTWWMRVQDPPVYMCPIDDHTKADKNLYRAYTKSGDVVDYYVWPALRLYEGGGVLAKGVVQYK